MVAEVTVAAVIGVALLGAIIAIVRSVRTYRLPPAVSLIDMTEFEADIRRKRKARRDTNQRHPDDPDPR